MSARAPSKVVVVGRDAALWLAANVIRAALGPAGVTVQVVELPSLISASDLHAAQPPLEALHNLLRIDESALLRATGGTFSLGQNFTDSAGGASAFFHAQGAYGAPIDGKDFFAYWLKARALGLNVAFEDFCLTAAAAKQGRMLIPDEATEVFGRTDYGYHLPAVAYVASLKALAVRQGVTVHQPVHLHGHGKTAGSCTWQAGEKGFEQSCLVVWHHRHVSAAP